MQTAHALAKVLLCWGLQVSVCTTSMDTHVADLTVPLNHPVDVVVITVIYSQVVKQRWLRRWGVSLSLPANIWRALSSSDVAVLHFHYQFATWLAALLCRLRRKPYIIFTHGSLNARAIQASGAKKKRLYLSLLEKENFRGAAFIAYQSEEEMENSLLLNPRSVVIPNGLDPASLSSPVHSGLLAQQFPELKDKFIYLFLGRIDPNKGLDILLPAFAKIHAAHPQTHLLLAGPDERGYQSQVENLAQQLGISTAVTFTGFLGGDLRAAALHQSNSYVLPSRYEGLSMSMLEALYCKLPVITTPYVGLWKRLEQERCALISQLDVDSLAKHMEFILQNPEEARQMGLRGRDLVEREHNWDVIATRLLSYISGALTDQGVPNKAVS